MLRRYAIHALGLAAMAALAACQAGHGGYMQVDAPASTLSGAGLDTLLIAVPKDGSFAGKSYLGSGHFVAYRATEEFKKYAKKVEMAADEVEGREALTDLARKNRDAYLVVPTVVQWEYRVKGIPSRARID